MLKINKNKQNIASNKWNENVIKYRIGDNLNLYGTILGFRRGWKNNQPNIDNYFSFLIFFNHSTGRIEHFKFNYGKGDQSNQNGKLDRSFFMTFLFELFKNKETLKRINGVAEFEETKLQLKTLQKITKEIQIPKYFSSKMII